MLADAMWLSAASFACEVSLLDFSSQAVTLKDRLTNSLPLSCGSEMTG